MSTSVPGEYFPVETTLLPPVIEAAAKSNVQLIEYLQKAAKLEKSEGRVLKDVREIKRLCEKIRDGVRLTDGMLIIRYESREESYFERLRGATIKWKEAGKVGEIKGIKAKGGKGEVEYMSGW